MRWRVPRRLLPLLLVLLAASAAAQSPVPVELQDRLADLKIEHDGDGVYVIIEQDGANRRIAAEDFLAAVEAKEIEQRQNGLLFVIFNISGWQGVIWVGLGLLGQVLFTGRMLVQWLASEKEKRSVVPVAFWWMSLIGATMLIVYFGWRKDIVGLLGQATGWLIYVRNLWMIHSANHRKISVTLDPAPEPELPQ
jgi:lipid-A-disaccharide synthase-like uncharacterized protein